MHYKLAMGGTNSRDYSQKFDSPEDFSKSRRRRAASESDRFSPRFGTNSAAVMITSTPNCSRRDLSVHSIWDRIRIKKAPKTVDERYRKLEQNTKQWLDRMGMDDYKSLDRTRKYHGRFVESEYAEANYVAQLL